MPNARSPKGGLVTLLVGVGTVLGSATPVLAQDTTGAHQIQWYEATIALVGVSAFFLVDNPVRSYMLDNQTATKSDVAEVLRTVGEPEVWALVPAVMIVRDNVWLTAVLTTCSSGSRRFDRVFSRTRSKMTIVSLTE